MNQQNYKQDYDRDGFVIVRNFLPAADFKLLTDNLDRYISQVVPTLPATAAFYHDPSRAETLRQLNHMQGDPFFDQYQHHPAWNKLAELLVGEPVQPRTPEWFNKPPGNEHTTPPHQDNYYFCLVPPNVITLWLALDKVDEENGCLRYVVGSHRRGLRPHSQSETLGFSQGISDYGPDDQAAEQTILLQPGDLVAHHGNTIHRADPNRSGTRNRRAFAMVLKGESCQRDEAAYARYESALANQHEKLGIV